MAQEGAARPKYGLNPAQGMPETKEQEQLRKKRAGRLSAAQAKERKAPQRKAPQRTESAYKERLLQETGGPRIEPGERLPSYYNPRFSKYMQGVQQDMRDVWETYGRDYDTGRVSNAAMYAGLDPTVDPRTGRSDLPLSLPPSPMPDGGGDLDALIPGQIGSRRISRPPLSREEIYQILEKRYPGIRDLPPVILEKLLVSE